MNKQQQEELNIKLFNFVRLRQTWSVKETLDEGADPNATRRRLGIDMQETPLHLAAFLGFTTIARLLLERGADPNAKDSFEKTPAEVADAKGYVETAEMLRTAAAAAMAEKQAAKEAAMGEKQGVYKTGRRQWVATLPPEDDTERSPPR
jgi:hypothetical protein